MKFHCLNDEFKNDEKFLKIVFDLLRDTVSNEIFQYVRGRIFPCYFLHSA